MKKKKVNYTVLFLKTVICFIGAETTIAMMVIGLIDKLF